MTEKIFGLNLYIDKYDYELNNINNNNIEEEINQIEEKLWDIDENKLKLTEHFDALYNDQNKNSTENFEKVNLEDENIKELRLQNLRMQICNLQIKQFVESIMNVKKSLKDDKYFLIFDPCEKMESIIIDGNKYNNFMRYRDTLNSTSIYDLFQEKIHSY